ncbi:MAG: sugar ABC transporter substrate-binding protein, partial [Trebonia sp.]
MTQAKQVVDAAEAPITVQTQPQPIDMSKLKGKLVYFVSLPSGYSLRLWNGFAAAAHVAGLNPVFGAGSTPEQWNASIQQAVARHAAGIMIMAVTPSLVASSVAQAKAAGIPVVSQNTIPPAATGMDATVLVSSTLANAPVAYAATQTGCKLNALLAYDPSFVGFLSIAAAASAEVHRLCPTTCTTQNLSVSVATMVTDAGPSLQSTLQRDPSINAVIPLFDSLALVMQPALAQSGSSAKMY